MIELIGCKAENLRNRNLQTAKILPLPLIPSHQGLIFTHNLGCWTQGVLEDMGHAS